MTKAKPRRRKMRLVTRAINGALLALAFSPAIRIAMKNMKNPDEMVRQMQLAYTGIGRDGTFDAKRLAEGYTPVIVAFVLFEIKKHAMRKFKV